MASIISKMAAGVAKVKKAVQNKFDALANYKVGSADVALPIDLEQETVWATYEQIADLFGTQSPAVIKHVSNIFSEGELEREATTSKMEVVRMEGQRQVRRSIEHFNLDVILAVGYRVNSKRATEFRKWASGVLKGYIQDGYALNGKRLNSDPAALLNLAREVRAIRTSEMNLYTQVRETFAQCSIDYDKDDPAARKFFADSQNVFHFAASELTASQILLNRADASKPNMGLVGLGNQKPTAKDVTVAKNYCTPEELRKMELIGESWLLYAEGMAMQGKQVSMQRLLDKLTDLVEMHEFPVFPGYKGIPQKATADAHAKAQYELFKTASTKQIA
ncbi:virulence RhuM family protein [Agrobacterium sp. S2/73]|uniref:RhuM family protein n=1 Tax=unclassified Agrobacterium TaxID=2632611 RepID=UPI001AD99A2A|nr:MULTISPECIES: RhuM family protein [unclassified Agrobacterium]MBO9108916.1 virulence RhuM family protein [Agrobacterium sp. S2/73]QXZ73334.1 virulence RhuM family protein [Agrobacterium sp. S7/73]